MTPKHQRLNPNTVVLLKHIGMGVVVIGIVALLLTVLWYGTRVPSLTLVDVKASGGETIAHTEVEKLVQDTLEGNYLGFIPRRFAWLYPEQEVIEKVSAQERIYNVQVTRHRGTGLIITYSEYVPHALWCTSITEESCVFLDDQGYAFSHAPQLSGGSFLRFVTSGREAVIGEVPIEKSIFTAAEEVVRLLAEKGWFVSHVEIDQVGDVFLSLVGGGELKIHTEEAPALMVENLLTVLTAPEFEHVEPGNFQYIDLRYGNKVFINEEIDREATTTASTSEVVAPL